MCSTIKFNMLWSISHWSMKSIYSTQRKDDCNFQEAGFWSMKTTATSCAFLCNRLWGKSPPCIFLTFIRLTLLQWFPHQMDGSPQVWCMCEFLRVNLNVVDMVSLSEQKAATEADNWFLYPKIKPTIDSSLDWTCLSWDVRWCVCRHPLIIQPYVTLCNWFLKHTW